MSERAIRIFHEGDAAFAAGEPREANPYPGPLPDDRPEAWTWWLLGWDTAKADPLGPLARPPTRH